MYPIFFNFSEILISERPPHSRFWMKIFNKSAFIDRLGFAAREEFAARQNQNQFQKLANKDVERVEFRSRDELKKSKKNKNGKKVSFNISW